MVLRIPLLPSVVMPQRVSECVHTSIPSRSHGATTRGYGRVSVLVRRPRCSGRPFALGEAEALLVPARAGRDPGCLREMRAIVARMTGPRCGDPAGVLCETDFG
ncbi:hypothetical protein GCM10027200_67910 [Lentzea nigeriaca]